jgi:hypothetical protein
MVITAQMIRDILTFNGPMSFEEIQDLLNISDPMDEMGLDDAINRALGLNFIYIDREIKDKNIYISNWRE